MGRYAVIEDGLVTNVILLEPDTPGFEDAVACADEVGPGWAWDGEEFTAPEMADQPPPPAPSTPVCVATATLSVSEGVLEGVETAVGLSMAFAIDVGVYWVFFSQEQPDMNYNWNAGASSGTINVSSRDLTMMELRAYDGGAPADPSEISIQVFRVV